MVPHRGLTMGLHLRKDPGKNESSGRILLNGIIIKQIDSVENGISTNKMTCVDLIQGNVVPPSVPPVEAADTLRWPLTGHKLGETINLPW